MTPLIYFYLGTGNPYYISDILYKWNDDDWEKHHDFIQWLFPTTTKSKYNIDAPLLTFADAEMFRKYQTIKNLLGTAVAKYEQFIFRTKSLTCFNHNFLRISRVIQCLKELGFDDLAKKFYDSVLRECKVKGSHITIWKDIFENTKPLID